MACGSNPICLTITEGQLKLTSRLLSRASLVRIQPTLQFFYKGAVKFMIPSNGQINFTSNWIM
jgi:hypothetical protein